MESYLPLMFFIIAFLYATVGFGGGSSYLAILSIFIADFYEIRSTALVLNLCVVSIGTLFFIRHRVFNWKDFWPFLVASVPVAYLGAMIKLSDRTFFLVLGALLILSGLALLHKYLRMVLVSREFKLPAQLGIGAAVGFFAGLTGIGGGIYLSPVLNMMGWKDARKIASLASVFILVNSLSGLAGLISSDSLVLHTSFTLKLAVAVALGGGIGAYMANRKFNTKIIGLLTAVLVIYVGLRLILLHQWGIEI